MASILQMERLAKVSSTWRPNSLLEKRFKMARKYNDSARNTYKLTEKLKHLHASKGKNKMGDDEIYSRLWHQNDYVAKLDTFHRAIKPYIFFAQTFGIMPLLNILAATPWHMKFSLKAPVMIFTYGFFLFGGLKAIHYAKELFESGLNEKNLVGVVFYIINIWVAALFLNLARKWPKLIKYWTRVELNFLQKPYKQSSRYLQKKIGRIVIGFFLSAIVEHMLYTYSNYYNFSRKIQICEYNNTHYTFRDFLIVNHQRDIFALLPWSIPAAIYGFYLNGTFTIVWNFMDVFIMIVSVGLSARFEQFGTYISNLTGTFISEGLWCDLRKHHILLCELVDHVSKHLSSLIITSALFNMYMICNILLNIFKALRWPINYIYFWFSLGFLLTRAASVFLYASRLPETAAMPLETIYYVKHNQWNEEVQRFLFQIRNETVGLSGNKLFILSRQSLFGLAASIITYELMLLQFDAKSSPKGLPDLCE